VANVRKVLIVGGGIAGLTLAVALRRRGLGVELAEIQPRWNVLGVGISLTGPTLRALKSIDLIDPCVAVSFGFERIVFADAAGREFAALGLPKLCGPDYPATVAIGRPALHDVLIRETERLGADLRLGTTVARLDQVADAVDVTFSDGRRGRYDAVIGCDGLRSSVRNLVFGDVADQNFTGLAVWRATMPRLPDVTCMQMFYGPNTKAGVNPHSRDDMFLFLVQPIRSGERLPPDRMHLLLAEQLADFSGPVLEHARAHITDPAKVDYRPMNAFLLPPPWHRGHVAVIGDAAHTTTPHLATGAGIAIEDAVVLAEMLADEGSVPAILERFVERRFARCKLVVDTAVRLGEMEKDKSIPIQAHFELMGSTFRKLAEPI
jgi:2-polyprenyl-6-methoxyphenol hydroxylase-like FAD-dependent oxidoreductase